MLRQVMVKNGVFLACLLTSLTQSHADTVKTLVVEITVVDSKAPAVHRVNALMMQRQRATEKWFDFLAHKKKLAMSLPAHDAQVIRVSDAETAYVPTGTTYGGRQGSSYDLVHGPFSWTQPLPGNYTIYGDVSIESRLNTDQTVSMIVQIQEHKRFPDFTILTPKDWQQLTMKGAWRVSSGETVRIGLKKEKNNVEHIIYATVAVIRPNQDFSPTSSW